MLVPTLSLHDYRLRLKPGIPRRLNRIPYTEIILYIQDHPFKTKSEEPFKISVCAFAPSIQDDVTLETSYREHPLASRGVALRRVASRCIALRRVALRRVASHQAVAPRYVYTYISHVRIPLCNRPLYRANPTAAGRSNAVGCRTTHRAEVEQTNACERATAPRLVIKGNDRQWNY